MSEKRTERIVIFIDGSNLYHILKNIYRDSKNLNEFNFEKFIKFLTREREYVKTYYYNTRLDITKNPKKYSDQQRFFDSLSKIPYFNLVLCRMQKVKKDGRTTYEVKEDDINLAVDMVEGAWNDKFDIAILVSSDGDFVPSVKSIKRSGKKVENVGFFNKFSYHLKEECSVFRK